LVNLAAQVRIVLRNYFSSRGRQRLADKLRKEM